jgi:hypothetical protein
MDETHLFLSVRGFGADPSAVTRLLGEPSRAFVRGEPLPGAPGATR